MPIGSTPWIVSASLSSFLRMQSRQSTKLNLSGDPVAQNFLFGTVLFADVAGFTAWASNRPPKDVFHFLEKLYQQFDRACEQNKVFKVETIGDCYMCV